MHARTGLLFTAVLLCAEAAHSNTSASLETALKECAGIADSEHRLVCFDQVAMGVAIAAPPAAAVPKTGPLPTQSFGSYAAEHPAIVRTPQITAKVTALSQSAAGRPALSLDNAQIWELDAADPILALGESVTIKRAALGSYLLTTAGGRVHRAHRLK